MSAAVWPPAGWLEHPHQPGVFYDAGIVYIHTGDAVKDLAHRMMMVERTGCIPQTVVIGFDGGPPVGQPISPTEARRLADAGVPGVPDFVKLTGRPIPSQAFDPPAPPAGPVSLSPNTKGLTE